MFITPEELDAQLEAIVVDMEHDLDYHNLDADEYGEKYLELEDDEYDGQPTEYEEWLDKLEKKSKREEQDDPNDKRP